MIKDIKDKYPQLTKLDDAKNDTSKVWFESGTFFILY